MTASGAKVTYSEHLFREFHTLMDADPSGEERLAKARALQPLLQKTDAYVTMFGPCQSHLPSLDWNAQFRKAYAVLMWIRPRLQGPETGSESEDKADEPPHPRVLYRISTQAEESKAVGVCVTCSEWKVADEEGGRKTLQTIVTAYSLPSFGTKDANPFTPQPYSSYVQLPLTLNDNEWHLLGFTHTFPYLKKSTWSMTLDGALLGRGELRYPITEKSMDYCTILNNIVCGSASYGVDARRDDQKPASELHDVNSARLPWVLDLAAVALYAEEVSPNIQAVIAEAGVNLCLQNGGRIVPTLPPVPNWSKGSSFDGPKVGIPLTVHSAALEIQQLSGRLIFGATAVNSRVLGVAGSQQRITCPLLIQPGSTDGTPRVGLIQPALPIRVDEEDVPVLYINGQARVFHSLSDALLDAPETLDPTCLNGLSQNLSIVWQEKGVLNFLVMPFFLALCPPGKMFGRQQEQFVRSGRHLHALFSSEGQYAALLIRMLADAILHGGARIHEEVLQNGTLHILASSLRLSLLRAQRAKLFLSPTSSAEEIIRRLSLVEEDTQAQSPQDKVSPMHVPPLIIDACTALIESCCGLSLCVFEDLSPAMQIHRTSDLALTALFGFALDFDLWCCDVRASAQIFAALASRYGGMCRTVGFVLRSQLSVQCFLDCVRLRFSHQSSSKHLDTAAMHLTRVLQNLLVSSLSNKRYIYQGEHDVHACVQALSECPLGGFTSHIILHAMASILVLCDVLPTEAIAHPEEPSVDDEHKMLLASRLGRNLLVAQFHDVVVPMLLSRSIVPTGDESTFQWPSTVRNEDNRFAIAWNPQWQLCLVLFSWVASIAGSDGLDAAKATGSLMLASALAGSLERALYEVPKTIISSLFLPPPAMAMMIGSNVRDEWSYVDLLSDRLQIMVPLIPAMVLSLMPQSMKSPILNELFTRDIATLCDLVSAVSAAFHRVHGGTIHSTGGSQRFTKNRRDSSADAIKAARAYTPHLIVILVMMEDFLKCKDDVEILRPVTVMKPQTINDTIRREDMESWVDVSRESTIDSMAVVPLMNAAGDDRVCSALLDCQSSLLNTAAGLISNAMRIGGAGTSLSLLLTVLNTLAHSAAHLPNGSGVVLDCRRKYDSNKLLQSILCRLLAAVVIKSLKRNYRWETWSYELGVAMSRLVEFIEEKQLLNAPMGRSSDGATQSYNSDQIILISSLLNILEYGRDTTGWCQLMLPVMSSSDAGLGERSSNDLSSSSKVLLPTLQPCIRTVVRCIPQIMSETRICLSAGQSAENSGEECLLGCLCSEIDSTLTAATVGLAFPAARDLALDAMSTLRKAVSEHENAHDEAGAHMCSSLFCKIADELRERYKVERRLRQSASFDAYANKSKEAKPAVDESRFVELLITGGDLVNFERADRHVDADVNEEIVFDPGNADDALSSASASDDFILFSDQFIASGERTRLGYASYEGLNMALEKCESGENDTRGSFTHVVKMLTPYLDAWEAAAALHASNPDVLRLFNTLNDGSSEASTAGTRVGGSNDNFFAGPESVADAMSAFFDFAATEKSRLKDFGSVCLPNYRQARTSYSERFCWSRFYDYDCQISSELWERGVPDGNRDVRSRISTVPCSPQFRRYIPKYLDHSPNADDDTLVFPEQNILLSSENASSDVANNATADKLDIFTRALLDAGKVAIIDITKNAEVDDDDKSDILVTTEHEESLDDGDDIFFADSFVETGQMNKSVANEIDTRSASINLEEEHTFSTKNPATSGDALSMEDLYASGALASCNGQLYTMTSSAFSTAPDNSSSSLNLMKSSDAKVVEIEIDGCLHVKAEGTRQCTVMLTTSHLILEYDSSSEGFYEGELLAIKEEAERSRMSEERREDLDDDSDVAFQRRLERKQREVAAQRPMSIRWNLSEASHIFLRRYRLRDSALELFFIPSGGASFGGFGAFSPTSSIFLDFGPGGEGRLRRDAAACSIMNRSPPQALKEWPDRSVQFLHDQLSRLTTAWAEGRVTNFDYLLHLNMLAGRSYNDVCQYPVFPWVLSNYTSDQIPDLHDPANFRDLSKPVGALNPNRLEDFIERFNTFADPSIPPFMYGSHYSTSAGVVLHFLVRLHPFAGLHRQLQSGHFDVADRLFSSVPRTWSMCTGSSAAEVKELTPEFYCNTEFLKNLNNFKLGTSQDGETVGDVTLPPWADGHPETFIAVMRAALESEISSNMLPDWIDLIFGRKQQGQEAVKANNVFFYLTYYGSVDVASIEDEGLRLATELQIAHFGQCPMQLFKRSHVRRFPKGCQTPTFYQVMSGYSSWAAAPMSSRTLAWRPFAMAPLSHWVHLDAPPPGPHSALIGVRLAGVDRCFAIDAKGTFHSFRWAWRTDETPKERNEDEVDFGCFIAQRELPRFKSVPRLMMHSNFAGEDVVVAISKTLFAARSVFLVLSAGDAFGGLGVQLVDPAKGIIRGEILVVGVHSERITCIATDPIGSAAGHGGVGGELAIVGSADGTASLWRFMSSHYLPLRPRVRFSGHEGGRIYAVALCVTSHIAITVSALRCCVHTLGNGNIMCCFAPPSTTFDLTVSETSSTTFGKTSAVALSVEGFVVVACETIIGVSSGPCRTLITLHLFSIEGHCLCAKLLESWRGVPRRMFCTPDGTAVIVCCGRGVSIHRVSVMNPLETIDEMHITEADTLSSRNVVPIAYDIDFGPSLNRPVVAAAACSDGVLRLHALPGISAWAMRHAQNGLGQTVGSALAKPAQRLNRAFRDGWGMGKQLAGMGRDIGKEVKADVKERGLSHFLGGVITRKSSAS